MERFMPGAHTPTHSISDSPAATPEAVKQTSSDRKHKEEYEYAKARLSDSKFDIKDYPDPLLPRTVPQEKFLPKGMTAEMGTRLQQVVASAKASV